jgi:hypothetical protein
LILDRGGLHQVCRERQEVVLVVVAAAMNDELSTAAILDFDDWHVPSILAEFEVSCL